MCLLIYRFSLRNVDMPAMKERAVFILRNINFLLAGVNIETMNETVKMTFKAIYALPFSPI